MNPGDTRGCARCWSPRTALNEGRGVNPGDTAVTEERRPAGSRAQRRPGREPRRHPPHASRLRVSTDPLNEGRGVNPGDTSGRRPSYLRSASLNEGRGVNPGDTCACGESLLLQSRAQRRPGREPRRHPRILLHQSGVLNRAQRRPGREPRRHGPGGRGGGGRIVAQRRPGREPRRHAYWMVKMHLSSNRSTKAGA